MSQSPLRKISVMSAALLCLGLTLVNSVSAQSTRNFTHAQGQTEIASVPQRVVVLDLAVLDILTALDIPVVGVPSLQDDMWPDYMQKYAGDKYTKAGSLFEPDLDVIKTLKPDLIIVGGRSSRSFDAVSAIAPTIDLSTSTTGFVPSVVQNVLTLGAIFEVESQANAKARQLLQSIRELQANAASQGEGLLLFSVGERVMPQQPATRFGIVYELIGIQPVVKPEDAGPARSRGRDTNETEAEKEAREKAEAKASAKRLANIMSRKPNWIFVIDRNSAFNERQNSAEILAADPAISASSAWNDKKVVYLSGRGWYLVGGGVTQLETTIKQLAEAFDQHSTVN